MKWTEWSFDKFGVTLDTRYGRYCGQWIPYQTLLSVGRLRLHCFHRGDGDKDPHDHMWDFWTYPLTSYVEKVYSRLGEGDGHGMLRVVRRGRFHKRPAEYAHIVLGKLEYEAYFWGQGVAGPAWGPGRIWTIVWVSKKRREWGFWTGGDVTREYDESCRKWVWDKRPLKWIPWRTYIYGEKDA